MQLPAPLHSWKVSPQEAINIQKILGPQIKIHEPEHPIRFVAGLDAAFSPDGNTCIAGVVLWDMLEQKVWEQQTALHAVYCPYIPGLLTFREAPALLAALEKLETTPDILMCDGQGIAHPRRLGIASHLGIFTNLAALGCGKSRLFGEHVEPANHRGAKTNLMHKEEIIGTVLCTKNKVKPLYVSVGHKINLAAAETIVLQCTTKYRLPEPTRLADRLVAKTKQEIYALQKKTEKQAFNE